jgi:hypothetical protein
MMDNPLYFVDPDGNGVEDVIILVHGGGEFEDAANTRKSLIEKSEGFDPKKDHVYMIEFNDLGELKGQIENAVADAGKNGYGKTTEMSFYSHCGSDGPIGGTETTGEYNLKLFTQNPFDKHQMTLDGWSSINYNFDEKRSIVGFYGCHSDAFALNFLTETNVLFTVGFSAQAGDSSNPNQFVASWFTGTKDIYIMDNFAAIVFRKHLNGSSSYNLTDKERYQEEQNPLRFEKAYRKYIWDESTFSTNVHVDKDCTVRGCDNRQQYSGKKSIFRNILKMK